MMRRARTIAAVLTLAAGAAALAPALAQPEQPVDRGTNRGPDRAQDRESDPDRLRDFLEQRLEQTRSNEAAFAALLARLDAGESAEVVGREAREAIRGMLEPLREWGGGRQADRPGAPDGPQPTVEELLELLGEVDAPMRERIRRMAEENPERARAMLRDAAPRLRELAQLKQDDPEAFRARIAMMQAGRDAFRAAGQHARAQRDGAAPDELARRRAEVADAVRRRLEFERSFKAREIDRLAQRVESLRAEVAVDAGQLDELVESETTRILEAASKPRDRRGGGPNER